MPSICSGKDLTAKNLEKYRLLVKIRNGLTRNDIRISDVSQTAIFTISLLLMLLGSLCSKDGVYLIKGIIAAASVWIHEKHSEPKLHISSNS